MHETVCRSLLLIIISIIIKCIYIAQDREKLQMRWVTVTMQQECLKSVSERRQRGVKVLPLFERKLSTDGNRTFRPFDVSPPGRFAPDCGRFTPDCFSMCLFFSYRPRCPS